MDLSDGVPDGQDTRKSHVIRSNAGSTEMMIDTIHEVVSVKERTKSKFDQLLKAALEDTKSKNAPKKKKKTKNTTLTSNDDSANQDLQQKTEFNDSDLGKLHNKMKRKEDKEGLINAGFEDSNQSESKLQKKNYSLPAIFSKSAGKSESTRKPSPDIIELVHSENLIPSSAKATADIDVKSKNIINASRPETAEDDDQVSKKSRKIKEKKEKRTKDALSTPAVVNTLVQAEESIANPPQKSSTTRQSKREERRRHRLAKEERISGAIVVEPPVSEISTLENGEDWAKESTPTKKPRKKKKAKSTPHAALVAEEQPEIVQTEKILLIKIHRVDRLNLNYMIKHPLVRVNVVDGATGSWLKKMERTRPVTQVYENMNSRVDYVLPIMTLPFNLKEKRSILPLWEEVLFFNESYDYFVKESSNVILFFEILDFLPMSTASNLHGKQGAESGWYHIAWAFLKVFHWWASCNRNPYPSTLYVTVCGVDPPANLQPALRSLMPLQGEVGRSASQFPVSNGLPDDIQKSGGDCSLVRDEVPQPTLLWSRLPGQSCKVPNKFLLSLPTSSKGCFVAAFSHNGRWLACGCHDVNTSPILIYEIPSGQFFKRLEGHTGLIYEVEFSKSDDCLLSASADRTARIWPLLSSNQESAMVLPHPSYVYTAHFHLSMKSVVVTGCYDTVIRIWDTSPVANKQLLQELEGHRAYVNTIIFNDDGTKMYSGDSKGVIRVWNVYFAENHSDMKTWNLLKEVICSELEGISITKLLWHSTFSRFLVQSQDGVIRIMDSESFKIIQRYKGYLNVREYLQCCITPCGNFIFTGSEDRCVYTWNTVTGDQVAVYSDLPHQHAVHCTVFHPFEHMVAFCSFGSTAPVLLYNYDSQVAQLGISHVQPQEASLQHLDASTSSLDASSIQTPNTFLDQSRRAVTFNLTQTSSSSCLDKIMRKLDTVLDVSNATSSSFQQSHIQELNATSGSWGSTFDGLGINPNAVTVEKAVALYDYNPQRSDELSFKRGDAISILEKESEQWWIGRLEDGRQGYAPANFLTLVGDHKSNTSNKINSSLTYEEEPRNVTAVLTKSGELAFISASEDEVPLTASTPIRKKRHRHRKHKNSDVSSNC